MLKTKSIRFNRIAAMLMVLIIMVGIMPTTVLADDGPADYKLAISGTRITSDNVGDISSLLQSGKASFDPQTRTLTLEDAVINVTGGKAEADYGIYSKDVLNIQYKGENKIVYIGTDAEITEARAVFCSKALTISGGSDDAALNAVGFFCAIKGYSLVIDGGSISAAFSGPDHEFLVAPGGFYCAPIGTSEGLINDGLKIINGADVNIHYNFMPLSRMIGQRQLAAVYAAEGFYLDEDSSLTVKFEAEYPEEDPSAEPWYNQLQHFRSSSAYGVFTFGSITVEGDVDIDIGLDAVDTYGMFAHGSGNTVTISGGRIRLAAANGIFTQGSIDLAGGDIHVAAYENHGVASNEKISFGKELLAFRAEKVDYPHSFSTSFDAVHAYNGITVDPWLCVTAPEGGGLSADEKYFVNSSGAAAEEVEILPRVTCRVSRNDGPEEEYPLTYSPAGSSNHDTFQVHVGDKIVVRLTANDGQILTDRAPNGPLTVAQEHFLTPKRSDDRKQLTITFEPTYLPDAAWTFNDVSRRWEHSYNKDESKAGSIMYLGGNYNNQFSCLTFEAVLGDTVWEVSNAQVTIPRGETIRVRVPLKTKDGRDIAVSKEVFENDYKFVYFVSYILHNGYNITHDGESSVIVELKVADNARTEQACWEFFFSNSYDRIRFSLAATVVECWCDMGERLIERPVSEAACTAGGCAKQHWECSKCGKLFEDADGKKQITDPKTVLTPAKGHEWVKKVDAEYLKSAADCENPAVYYESCKNCGISSKELYDLRAAAANFVPGSAETVTIDGVEFYILAVDDGKALLLTKETVAAMAFDSDSPAWEGSDIQKWLNGEWLAGKTRLAALAEPADIYTAAKYNDQTNPVESSDKVFLLSETDIWGKQDSKDVTNDAFYTYNGAKLTAPGGSWKTADMYGNSVCWWLRSPCYNDNNVATVTDYGLIHSYKCDTTQPPIGVRPAMWVRFADPDPVPGWQYKIGKIEPGSDDTVTIDGVEFHVLEKRADAGKALLLAKNVLDKPMAYDDDSGIWADSDLRTWLNGEWLDGMPELKSFALPSNYYLGYDGNTEFITDQVFLLKGTDVFDWIGTLGETLPAPGESWIAYDKGGTAREWWLYDCNSEGNQLVLDNDRHAYVQPTYKGYVRPAVWVPYKEPEWREKIESITPGAAETVTIDDVEFHVLAKENGNALLLTKNVLFNKDKDLVFGHYTPSWADSFLRDFMNGRMAEMAGGSRFFFPENAPTLEQYAQETEIYTPAGYDSSELVMTRDTFFLLSEADLFGTQNDHPEAGTKVFTYNGSPLPAPGGSWVATDEDGFPRDWWLRSPRNNEYSVAQVLDDGTLDSINCDANDYNGIRGVRPAVWIQYREPVPEPETFEDGKPLGHDWGKASYNWQFDASGNGICTAQHTCTREGCKEGEFEMSNATREETIAPTCTKPGKYTYTAIFTKTGFETQYEYRDIAPLGGDHEWQVEKWTWDYPDIGNRIIAYGAYQDYPVVTLKLKCSKCGDGVSVTVPKEELQRLTEGDVCKGGTISFIAEVDYEGVTYSDEDTFKTINPEGHLFDEPSYAWVQDLSAPDIYTCIAARLCTRNDCTHKEEDEVTVKGIKTIDPACGKPGRYTYTAEFKNPAFKTQIKQVPIDPLEHNWVEKAEDMYLKSAADCDHAAVYHKSCGRCGDKHTSETFTHGNPLGHNWVEKAEDMYLKSAADCDHAAVYHKSCDRCGDKHASETFESGNALGHDYGKWYVVTPATDRRKGLDRRDCKRVGCDHFETSETNMVEYKTELEERGNGKTTVEPADPQSGDGVKITVEPGEDSRVKEITVTDKEGNVIDVTDKGAGEYEFTMPEGDVKIVVEYEPKPAVTVDENEGGKTKVEPEYPDAGDEVKITVTPEEDKRVKEITVTDEDGNKIDVTDKGNGEYEFTMPDSDVSIKVVYEPKPTPEIPPTGDNSKLLLWVMLMCILGIVVIITSLKGKKHKYNS